MANYVKVAKKSEIDAGTGKVVDVSGTPVALFNVDGAFYAIHNTCLHRQGSLGEGELSGNRVACPRHGWQFDVTTGQNDLNPDMKVQTYLVQIEGDDIGVAV